MTDQKIKELLLSPSRRRLAGKSLPGFATIYFRHYLTKEPAEFHLDMATLLEDWQIRFLALKGFRGCAKSTWVSTILAIYAALNNKSKFIIPINETDDVVRLTIANIRQEVEHNELLRQDFGVRAYTERGKTKFTETNILLANGVRILGRSRGQKIRGLRHREHRPDLVLMDDVEEREKVEKKQYRDKTEAWIRSEVIPACEESKARLVVIGNELHTDAIMARLAKDPLFLSKSYPLIAEDGHCTWPGKYPTKQAIKEQEQKVGRTAWLREYLLKVVPPEGQEVEPEWIKTYKEIPLAVIKGGVGVDLAISKRETADYTSMVSGIVALVDGMPKIHILPRPINARLSSLETQNQMALIRDALNIYAMPTFFVEDVAYQHAAIELAQAQMIPVVGIRPGGDKRARLRTVATFIQNGTVLFPEKGAEDLIGQLLGFGIEEHDDLVDALVYLIMGLSQEGITLPEVIRLI